MTAEAPEWLAGLEEPPDDDMPPEGYAASDASLASLASDAQVGIASDAMPPDRLGNLLVNDVRAWLARFILTMTPGDLDLLALWAVHTHVARECYTSPRLQLDSPMPGSGKTTVLDHLNRLCHYPVQMAAVSSSALLARLLANDVRTMLIDEVDRTLDPKREGSQDVIAILNSGYRVGASRPVLEPRKGGGWDVVEMSTFSPVAMAGNNPNLPDDTRSRCIRVVLLPDMDGQTEESDWERIEDDATALGRRIADWAKLNGGRIRDCRPNLPQGSSGRNRERGSPLARVAAVVGGGWPASVEELALADLHEQLRDREDGLIKESPAVALLRHISEVWPGGAPFATSEQLATDLAMEYPEQWGAASPFGKPLTTKRMARMLTQAFRVHSVQPERGARRGYTLASLAPAFRRMKITRPGASDDPVPLLASDASDACDASDARAGCQCPNGRHGIHRPTCPAA